MHKARMPQTRIWKLSGMVFLLFFSSSQTRFRHVPQMTGKFRAIKYSSTYLRQTTFEMHKVPITTSGIITVA